MWEPRENCRHRCAIMTESEQRPLIGEHCQSARHGQTRPRSGHPAVEGSIGSQKRIIFPKGSITPVSSVFQEVVSNPGRM